MGYSEAVVRRHFAYEEAGILMKAIFKYVQKQEFDGKFGGERALEMSFIPIKNTLDRDEIKYKETCKKNSENAKKRWETEKINATAYEWMQNNTNYTDSDSENDSDTESVTVSGSIYKPSKDGKIQKNSKIEIPFRILYNRHPNKESNYELALKEYTDIINGDKNVNGEYIKMNAVGIANSCRQLIEIIQGEGGEIPPMDIFLKDTWVNYITCGEIDSNKENEEEIK